MGDIADMMLDGTLCEGCGVYIGGEGGFPQYCFDCGFDAESMYDGEVTTTRDGSPIDRPSKTNCPHCNKLVKRAGLADHLRAKHNAAEGNI